MGTVRPAATPNVDPSGVTLLRDAAHPILPYMARGAEQSIEDADVLARCLADGRVDPRHALRRYAAYRQEHAALQTASRQAGELMQLQDPAEIAARNARLGDHPEAPVARFDWLWNCDVEGAAA